MERPAGGGGRAEGGQKPVSGTLYVSMRAAEVARRIDAQDRTDMLTLAFDAGFSSKATFNRAFLAKFGVSPSDYRKRHRG